MTVDNTGHEVIVPTNCILSFGGFELLVRVIKRVTIYFRAFCKPFSPFFIWSF